MPDINRSEIVSALRGQLFTMPDMVSMFSDWPANVNPQLGWLRLQVDNQLKWLLSKRFPPQKAAKVFVKLQSADFGLFGAYWWPRADARTLRCMTLFSIWLFLWDDEIDSYEGNLSTNLAKAQVYRSETIEFVKHALELQTVVPAPAPANVLIYSFETIAIDLRKNCTIKQRQHLFDEINLFMKASEVEQRRKLSAMVPSVEEYMECRMGTSAVGCGIVIFEVCQNIRLPTKLCRSSDMRTIWDTTNILVSIVNDIVSLKKEIADGTTDNLIPLLWLHTRDLDIAMMQALSMLEEAKHEFVQAAARLYDRVERGTETYEQLHDFIEGCKIITTGNLFWSLATERYLGDQVGQSLITLS